MKTNISQFMLEMYRLDLVTPKERKQVEAALSSDEELRRRYEAIVESDREIRRRYPYPPEKMPVPAAFRDARKPGRGAFVRLGEKKRLLIGLGAAAVLVCALFFSVITILRSQGNKSAEIAILTDPDNEKGEAMGPEIKELSISIFKEGDSLRLVYTTPPEGGYEGVIFAVDGMPGSDVMPLFPADISDRPKLRSGRETLRLMLPEPAPDFLMFFLVASQPPLNVEAVINTANEAIAADVSAGESGRNPETVREKMYSAFKDYEVKHSYIRITN